MPRRAAVWSGTRVQAAVMVDLVPSARPWRGRRAASRDRRHHCDPGSAPLHEALAVFRIQSGQPGLYDKPMVELECSDHMQYTEIWCKITVPQLGSESDQESES